MAGEATRIAIVDDDPSVRRALVRVLTAASYSAASYPSPSDLIASLAVAVPHCLVADLAMPEMSGLDLHAHLVDAGFSIPTIIITGHPDTGALKRCQSAGIRHHLQKPLVLKDLLSAIETAVGR